MADLIPGLPYDMALSCIARVPRSSHPYLLLVSPSWRTLLRTPVFYDVRSEVGSTESFIYITVRARNSSSFQWLMLDPHAPNPKKLRPLSPPPRPFPSDGSACAVLGPRIFVIGGTVSDLPSSSVWIFDARFNSWERGPNMSASREFAAAGVVDGKIYVLGGCLVDPLARSSSWAEVFDPAVGSWASVPSPAQFQKERMHGTAVLGGKLFAMADGGGVVFDPSVEICEAWSNVSTELWSGLRVGTRLCRAAVVDGILYCYDYYLGKIRWYDDREDKWEEVKGIDKELPKSSCGTLTDLGGRLCVFWKGKGVVGKEVQIVCAEIVVVRESGGGGLRGSIVWSDVVDLVTRGSTIVNCLSVEL